MHTGDNRDRTGRVLAVFAHPDDESLACGGLLAQCDTLGIDVSLLCLTHGEHGLWGTTRGTEPTELARVRREELEAAAGVLGISDVTVLGHEDGMLPWIDADRLEQDIRRAISRAAAEVVITFDNDGLYWHPDHVAVHERVTATVAGLGAAAPALVYVTMPPGVGRAVVDHAAHVSARRGLPAPAAMLGVSNVDAFGSKAGPTTLVVDTTGQAVRKLRALECHRTQMAGGALALVGAEDAPRLLGREHYRRASVGAQGDTFLERVASPAPADPD